MAIQLPQKVRILANEPLGTAGRVLRLDSHFDFTPGQLVSLSQSLAGPSRLYSIASAPGNASLDIMYNLVPDGTLTPQLWHLQAGDELFLQGPRGNFGEPPILDAGKAIWWICNGTGVSPFISLIRHFQKQGIPKANQRTLVFGFRTPSDAWFLEELIAAGNAGLRTILCLSSAHARQLVRNHPLTQNLPEWHEQSENGHQAGTFLHIGRLTAWRGLREIPPGDLAMLCGSSLMISEVRDRLISDGMAPAQIFAETYF